MHQFWAPHDQPGQVHGLLHLDHADGQNGDHKVPVVAQPDVLEVFIIK